MAKKKDHKTPALRDVDFYISEWLSNPHIGSDRTRAAYRFNINKYIRQIGKPFDQVKMPDLLAYQAALSKKYADRTCRQVMATIRSFYHYMNSLEVTSLNLNLIRCAPIRVEVDHDKLLSVDEINAILNAAKPDPVAYLFVRFIYVTGMRKTEALGVVWRDMQPLEDGGYLNVKGKGRKHRNIFLPEKIWSDLLVARGDAADTDKVFPTLDAVEAWRLIKRLAKVAKVEKNVNVHSFRHACASHMLQEGATVAEVRDHLGHASLVVTSLYLHADPKNAPAKRLKIQ